MRKRGFRKKAAWFPAAAGGSLQLFRHKLGLPPGTRRPSCVSEPEEPVYHT